MNKCKEIVERDHIINYGKTISVRGDLKMIVAYENTSISNNIQVACEKPSNEEKARSVSLVKPLIKSRRAISMNVLELIVFMFNIFIFLFLFLRIKHNL